MTGLSYCIIYSHQLKEKSNKYKIKAIKINDNYFKWRDSNEIKKNVNYLCKFRQEQLLPLHINLIFFFFIN